MLHITQNVGARTISIECTVPRSKTRKTHLSVTQARSPPVYGHLDLENYEKPWETYVNVLFFLWYNIYICIIYIHVVSEMMIHCEHGDFGVACIFANNPTWRFPEMRATPKKSSIYNLYMDFPYFSMLLPTCWGSIDRNQVCHWDTEDWPCMAVGFCLVVSGRPDGGMNSPSQWAQQKRAEL